MWEIPQTIREHVKNAKQPKEIMINFFEESEKIDYEEVLKKINAMKLKSKYFNLDQIETLFRHIYEDFEEYLTRLNKNLGELDEEKEKKFQEKLKNILVILDDLCDEVYICYFRSFSQLVKIIEKSNDFDVKKITLSMCILLLGDNTMASNIKEIFLGGEETMKSLAVLALAFCNHVNAFANTHLNLNELLQSDKKNFRHLYIDSKAHFFTKTMIDLKDYEDEMENGYNGFLEKIRSDIEDKILNKNYLEDILKVIDFRAKLMYLPKKDENFWFKLVKLSLHSQILFHRNDKLHVKQYQKYAMNVFGVESPPKKIENIGQFKQLLKLQGDSTYHGSILKSYLSSFSSNDDELFEERTELLKKIISEISGEFVSRRSGSREGMMEERKSSYQKSSKFMNDYFGILMHYVKQYFSKLEEQEMQETCLFSEQILIFLDKSIDFVKISEMTEEPEEEEEKMKIVLGYEPKVYTQAIRIISTEPNPPVRTLDEFITILTRLLQNDEIYYVDSNDDTKKLDDKEFNHLCSSLLKGINMLRENYMKTNFALNIQTYVTKLNEAKFWKYIFLREESNFILKGNTLRVITDFFDEMPETSINNSIVCFIENGVFSELWNFVISCDQCDIQDFLYVMFLLTRVLINDKIEEEVKKIEFTKKIFKKMFSFHFYKNTLLELKIKKPNSELYYSCAEAFIFHVNVNFNQSGLVVSEVLKSLNNLLEIKKFFDETENSKTIPEVKPESPVVELWGGVTEENFRQKRVIFDHLMADASKFYIKLFDSHTSNLTTDLMKDSTFLEDSFRVYCHSGLKEWLDPVNYSYKLLRKTFEFPGNVEVYKKFMKIVIDDLCENLTILKNTGNDFKTEEIETCYRIFYGDKKEIYLEENEKYRNFVKKMENIAYTSKLVLHLLSKRDRITGDVVPQLIENEESFYKILDIHINFVIRTLNISKTNIIKEIYLKALESIPQEIEETKLIVKALSKVESEDNKKCLTITLNTLVSRFFELVLSKNEAMESRYMETLTQLSTLEYKNPDKIKQIALIMSSFSLLFHAIRNSLSMQNYIYCYQSGINEKFTEYTLAVYEIIKVKYSKILELTSYIDYSKKKDNSEELAVKISYEDLLSMRIISNNIQTILYPFARYVSYLDCKIREGQLKVNNKEIEKENKVEYCRYVRMKIFEGFKELMIGFCSHQPGEENMDVAPGEDEKDYKLVKKSWKFIVEFFNFGSFQKYLSKILRHLFKSAIKEGVEQPFNRSKNKNSRINRKNNSLIQQNKSKLLELGFPPERIETAIDTVPNPVILEELFEWLLANPEDSPKKEKKKEEIKEGAMELEEGMEEIEEDKLKKVEMLSAKDGGEILTDSFRNLCNECFNSVLFLRSEFDFSKLLSYFFRTTKNNKKFEKVFLFELYYIYLDTFMLILNTLAKLRNNSKSYLKDFKVVIPSNIIRKKENWGIDNSVNLKVKCREYNRIKDSKRRISFLLKDANSLLRNIIKILNFAGARNWSPSCSSELNYLLSFLNELVSLAKNTLKEGDKSDLYTINHNLSEVLQTTFELILQIMRIEPKMSKNNKLSKLINEKSKEKLKEVKINICKNLVKNSRVFLNVHQKVFKEHKIKILNRKNLSGFLKMLAECIRQSGDIKKSFLKKNYLKNLMRLDIKFKAENKPLISSIKEILMELVVDEQLIESSMESEIRYFFYAHEKKKKIENRKNRRKNPSLNLNQEKNKFEYGGVVLQKYLKIFKKLSSAQPETFVKLNSKICYISIPSKGSKEMKKLKKTNKAKYKQMKKKNSMVKCKEEEGLEKYDGASLKSISYNTIKATILIINEIIVSWIRKFESRMEVIEENCDRTFPKLLTGIFIDQILGKLPILGLIIRRYNCLEIVKKTAKSKFLLDRIEGISKLTFISFLIKIVIYVKPKEFRHLWTFINDSSVLIKVNGKVRPLSHEFRANIIREINFYGKQIGIKIKALLEDKENDKQLKEEFKTVLEVRAFSTLLMKISKHFNCLRAIVGKNFTKVVESELNQTLMEIVRQTSPEKISKYKKIFKFGFSTLSLLYKYSALLALNKTGVDEVTEFKYVGELEDIQQKNILQIQSPSTLLLNWSKVSRAKSSLNQSNLNSSMFKFKNPKVVLSSSNEPVIRDKDSRPGRLFDYRNREEDEYIEVGELDDPELYENAYLEEEYYDFEYQDDYYNSDAYQMTMNEEEYFLEAPQNEGWVFEGASQPESYPDSELNEEEEVNEEMEEDLSNDFYHSGNMMIEHLSNDRGEIEDEEEPTEYVITSADITGRLRESENRVNTEVEYLKPEHRYPYEGRKEFPSKVLNPFVFDEQRDNLERELMNKFEIFCEKFEGLEDYVKIIKAIKSGESKQRKTQRLNKRRRDLLIERLGPELFNDLANMNENVQDMLGGLIRLDGERTISPNFFDNLIMDFQIMNETTPERPRRLENLTFLQRNRAPPDPQVNMFEANEIIQQNQANEQEVQNRLMNELEVLEEEEEELNEEIQEGGLDSERYTPLVESRSQSNLNSNIPVHSSEIQSLLASAFGNVGNQPANGGINPFDNPLPPRQNPFAQMFNLPNNNNQQPRGDEPVPPQNEPQNIQEVNEEEVNDTQNGIEINVQPDEEEESEEVVVIEDQIPNQNLDEIQIQDEDEESVKSEKTQEENTEEENIQEGEGVMMEEIIPDNDGDDEEEEKTEELTIEETQDIVDEVQNHNTQMPSHCSPAPELITFSNQSRNEASTPNQENPQLGIEPVAEENNEMQENDGGNQIAENQQIPPEPVINFDFSALGLPNNFLEMNGIDKNYFSELPYDLQMEVIFQNMTSGNTYQNFGVTSTSQPQPPNNNPPPAQNTENNNQQQQQQDNQIQPPSNRSPADVLNQPQATPPQPNNTQRNTSNNTQTNSPRRNNPEPVNENLNFLNSLTPELRQEVLLTCPEDFLLALPPATQEEAARLRERLIASEMARQRVVVNRGRYLNPDQIRAQLSSVERQKLALKKQAEKAKHRIDPKLALKVNKLDDRAISGLIRLILTSHRVEKFEFELVAASCMNPESEEKLIGALMFLLTNEEVFNMTDSILIENNIYENGFPVYKGENMEKKYLSTILKILESLSYSHQEFILKLLKGKQPEYILEEVKVLLEGNSEFRTGTLEDILHLFSRKCFYKKEHNVTISLNFILNVIKSSIRTDESKELICILELKRESVNKLCHLLNNKSIKEEAFSILGDIISHLCFSQENLSNFIQELTQTIVDLSQNLNSKMSLDIQMLKSCIENPSKESKDMIEFLIIKRQNEGNSDEMRLYKLFKMILKLYEKSLEQHKEEEKSKTDHKATKEKINMEVRAKFTSLTQNENLRNMWLNICEGINYLESLFRDSKKVMIPAINEMKPLIESFFIMYKILCDDEMIEKIKRIYKSKSKSTMEISALKMNKEEEMGEALLNLSFEELRKQQMGIKELLLVMCEKNRKVLNTMIKQNIALLTGSLSVLPKKMPTILDFENKREYFKAMIDLRRNYHHRLNLIVRRNQIFSDSYNQIISKTPNEMRSKLHIEFKGEEGEDAGGVSREWFNLLSKDIFFADYALFIPSANGATYQPSPHSHYNPDHIRYFKFIGRVIGKALFDGFFMDSFFTRSFYKHMTGSPLTYEDIEDIDPNYFKNLKWILNNDVDDMELTFISERDNFGRVERKPLKENGENIKVTNENKEEYVNLICYERMANNIKTQIEAFLEGLHEVIPKDLLAVFDPRELELMISGLPEINIDDLRLNTQYHNYSKDSRAIRWFWEILGGFDREMKANFLQYVTGTSKVPVDGFKSLKGIRGLQPFQIHKAFDTKLLPTSHTCMNQLDLPEYETKEEMKEKMITAINWGKEGFGFL